MKLSFKCLHCREKNYITEYEIEECVECSRCRTLHEVKINSDSEVVIEKF